MPLDPLIAGGFRGIELQNPVEAYGNMMKLQQMQQQNELAALQMQRAQRDIEVENRLAQLYGRPNVDPTSPEFMREVYSISPLRGPAIQKSVLELEKEKRLADAASEDLATKRIANARAALPSITPESWSAWRADTIKKLPGLTNLIPEAYSDEARLRLMQSADQYLAERKPMVVAPGASVYKPGETTPMFTAPEKAAAPTELMRNYEYAKRQGFKGSLFDYEREIKLASRTPAQPSAPVAVVDDATGKIKYVTREEAFGKTPAAALEALPPKEIQKREAALPQAKSSVTSFEAKTDAFIKDLESLRDDPGLDQITGPIYGRTPSVSREGSRAQSTYNKIFAKGGFQGLQDLREASKTGGALGNVSNEEGRRLEASVVGGLDRTQHIDDVKKGINTLIEDLKVSKARVRNTFEDTYQYKQGGTSTTAPATLSPQDQAALAWARANSSDPRAAEIKRRLGVQ